jgi:hypothetical protein
MDAAQTAAGDTVKDALLHLIATSSAVNSRTS